MSAVYHLTRTPFVSTRLPNNDVRVNFIDPITGAVDLVAVWKPGVNGYTQEEITYLEALLYTKRIMHQLKHDPNIRLLDLAAALSVSANTVSNYVSGLHLPKGQEKWNTIMEQYHASIANSMELK